MDAKPLLLLISGLLVGTITDQGEEMKSPQGHAVQVTMQGKPVELLGEPVDVGAKAPEFRVVDKSFAPVRLSDFKGNVVLISAVPSLDTRVCSLQTQRFNQEAETLPDNVVLLTISRDLPFAQKRFCEAEKVDRIQVLSDSVWREFGSKYGLEIQDKGLLARSVFVIGKDGRVAYKELVSEMGNQPDYDRVLKAAREAAAAHP
jgi:thioredoxin-dependent peroxiredoxin